MGSRFVFAGLISYSSRVCLYTVDAFDSHFEPVLVWTRTSVRNAPRSCQILEFPHFNPPLHVTWSNSPTQQSWTEAVKEEPLK